MPDCCGCYVIGQLNGLVGIVGQNISSIDVDGPITINVLLKSFNFIMYLTKLILLYVTCTV